MDLQWEGGGISYLSGIKRKGREPQRKKKGGKVFKQGGGIFRKKQYVKCLNIHRRCY